MSEQQDNQLAERRLDALRHALGEIIMNALQDKDVVEIMLNDDGLLWVEKKGVMTLIGTISYDDGMAILRQVNTALDGELSKKNPFVSGELPIDDSRFQGISPPVVQAPTFTIRKKALRVYSLEDYIRSGYVTFHQAEIMRTALVKAKNIIVAGATGTGKTTFCNALLREINIFCPEVRMLIMEDTRELQCSLRNHVSMRATEWTSLNELSPIANRMRPDRITVGEVRAGGPALALLKLWNTGHPGGLGTLHSNSPYETLERVDQMIQEVSATPQRHLIGSAIDYVIYLKRKGDRRYVDGIIEVDGYDPITQRFITEAVN